MSFKRFLESKVLAHISGASGSGKTSIANELNLLYPHISFIDLDDFDEQAEKILNYKVSKKHYTDKMLFKLAQKRQELMDKFIKESKNPIIFVGHHTEGDQVLYIPTETRILLNTDAKTSAWRAYLRSQNEKPEHRRTLEELPKDEKEAQEVIDWLLKNGYKSMSKQEILRWMRENY